MPTTLRSSLLALSEVLEAILLLHFSHLLYLLHPSRTFQGIHKRAVAAGLRPTSCRAFDRRPLSRIAQGASERVRWPPLAPAALKNPLPQSYIHYTYSLFVVEASFRYMCFQTGSESIAKKAGANRPRGSHARPRPSERLAEHGWKPHRVVLAQQKHITGLNLLVYA